MVANVSQVTAECVDPKRIKKAHNSFKVLV